MQRFALDQFAGNVLPPCLYAKVKDDHDVGVVERSEGAGFLLESAVLIGARRNVFVQNLDGDIAIET